MTERFVGGHALSRALHDIVAPAINERLPGLRFASALIGQGSDVLGYDSIRSTDHDWGPRLCIVVADGDVVVEADVLQVVDECLPETVLGVPVEVPGSAERPNAPVRRHHSPEGRTHGVTVTTVRRLVQTVLGTARPPQDWDVADWLAMPQQAALEMTAGPVHRDDDGALSAVRSALAWYPDDVWRYVMSARWDRIAQLEAFIGRSGETGDDLGSRVLAASMVRDVMRLALLQERWWAPYPKWLGTAFARLVDDDGLQASCADALAAATWRQREAAVVTAVVALGRRHDALGLTAPLRARARTYFTRPFLVVGGERFADALRAGIADATVSRLPTDLGAIDEITDSTRALKDSAVRAALAGAWREAARQASRPQ